MNSNIKLIEEILETNGVLSDNPGILEHFDDRKFRFCVALVNQDGYCVKLMKNSIVEMKIVDDLQTYFHHGYMIFENPDDVLEKPASTLESFFSKPKPPSYRFRNDARDLLYIKLEPFFGADEESIPVEVENQVYTIKMLFTIYSTEDITTTEGVSQKKTKIKFHDYRHQALLEKNLYYSTAKNLPGVANSSAGVTQLKISPRQLSNTNRSKPTGEIVQDILRSTFLPNDTKNTFAYDWDMGGSELLYTSPSNYKAIDDLRYILSRHTSTTETRNQPSILKLDRYNNIWSFCTLETYFARGRAGDFPGTLQSERFLLSFQSNPDNEIIPPEPKTYGTTGNVMVNYHFPDISLIDDYTFVEMNGEDTQLLLNSSVTTRYDEGMKQFSLDMNSASTTLDVYQSLYASKTLGSGGSAGSAAWTSDTSRDGFFNFNVSDSWSNEKAASLSVSRNKKLLAATMLGNTIQFYVRGDTTRRTGVWISVDKAHEYVDSEYDEKVLGQYFVIRVEHEITPAGTYRNSVIGVKPYTFKPNDMATSDMLYKNTNEVTEDE